MMESEEFLLFFDPSRESTFLPLFHRSRRKKSSALSLAAGPLGIIKERYNKRKITYEQFNFSIHDHDDNWCLEFLRFNKTQIIILAEILEIESRFRYRYRASATTALSMVLFRLSWPSRYKEFLIYFGHAFGWCSTVINDVCVFLHTRFKDHLFWDSVRLTQEVLTTYCTAIYHHGEPSGCIWGFIDGTHRPICRPSSQTADQNLLYSGYKKMHTMVWQAVITPDGLISSLSGPWEGKRGDWGVLRLSGLQDKIKSYCYDTDGDRVYIYGDAAYYLEDGIIGAYRAGRNRPLTDREIEFNRRMAAMRVSSEWGFGKIANMWSFCGYKNEMKIGLSPVGSYYFCAVLFTNCHTCFNGSVTGNVFRCLPPTIWEYFGREQ